jgi:hypothetical protein
MVVGPGRRRGGPGRRLPVARVLANRLGMMPFGAVVKTEVHRGRVGRGMTVCGRRRPMCHPMLPIAVDVAMTVGAVVKFVGRIINVIVGHDDLVGPNRVGIPVGHSRITGASAQPEHEKDEGGGNGGTDGPQGGTREGHIVLDRRGSLRVRGQIVWRRFESFQRSAVGVQPKAGRPRHSVSLSLFFLC